MRPRLPKAMSKRYPLADGVMACTPKTLEALLTVGQGFAREVV